MSLRLAWVVCFAFACGGNMKVTKGEPQTAREKMLAEQKANPEKDDDGEGKKWNGWRYQGERKDCFYLVGRKCFKTEKAACRAAKCGAAKCEKEGAGPATLTCAGKAKDKDNDKEPEKPAEKPEKKKGEKDDKKDEKKAKG